MTQHWDAIVIGSGAAGLSAALMLGRARRRVLVVDDGQPRNRFAAAMHGVLGSEGEEPSAFIARGRQEAGHYGVEFAVDRVHELSHGSDHVVVTLVSGTVVLARSAVVATGVTDVLPAIPGLAERWGVTVLHCPYCHGWEVRDRRLGVLTTSTTGIHQAQLVRQWSDDIVVFTAGAGELDAATAARLRSRDIDLVGAPVVEVLGEGTTISGVRTADGRMVEVDALFTAATLEPRDGFLAKLDLERTDTPAGSFLAVDATGQTSSPRIWAAGNVTNPMASVPIAIAAGATVGAMVNMALITEDFDNAADGRHPSPEPADFPLGRRYWEERYASPGYAWSGEANPVLVAEASSLSAGRALDIGSGEGGDALWLAGRGWDVTAVDISSAALDKAQMLAESVDPAAAARIHWERRDVTTSRAASETYDLVSSQYMHLPAPDRSTLFQSLADAVAPGGTLLVTGHDPADLGDDAHVSHFRACMFTADEVVAAIADSGLTVSVAQPRARNRIAQHGSRRMTSDIVVKAVRDS